MNITFHFYGLIRDVKLIFTGGHSSLEVAFKGPNGILGLYKSNCSSARVKELGAATGEKQGSRPDKTRWRAGFSLQALCLPPVPYRSQTGRGPADTLLLDF